MGIKLIILAILLALFGARPAFAAVSVAAPTNVPTEIQINQTFSINSSLNSAQSGAVYFVKCRIGSSSSSLTEGQTFNSSTWLSDTGSWTDMPTTSITSSSSSFSIDCRVKSDASEGQKIIYTRACLKKSDGTCGTSFQSSSGVTFTALATSATPTSTPTPTPSASSASSSFTISNIPSSIDSTETFNASVNLSLSSKPNAIFYLKGAFKKQGETNYFGLTKVGNSWIKNSTKYEDQYKITTNESGTWSGNLEIQPDIFDSGYEGAGEYIFKVGRYTEEGSLNWSNESNIKINAQEVVLEENNSEVLGAVEKQSQKSKTKTLKGEEYSLEKYIKVATHSSSSASATPSAVEVKNQKQNNPFVLIGIIFIIAGIGSLGHLIFRNKYGSIYHIFRK